MSNTSDFIVENAVLAKYLGLECDVAVLDGAKVR